MIFLVDAQLPVAMARWLAAKGHQAQHVSEVQMQSASDSAIWHYAHEKQAVIITKDEDFANKRVLVLSGPTIVGVRLGNARNNALIDWLERGYSFMLEAIERGETLIELA
ncbi:DUF5615 family PIN-like protein [Rhizobium sp.]